MAKIVELEKQLMQRNKELDVVRVSALMQIMLLKVRARLSALVSHKYIKLIDIVNYIHLLQPQLTIGQNRLLKPCN